MMARVEADGIAEGTSADGGGNRGATVVQRTTTSKKKLSREKTATKVHAKSSKMVLLKSKSPEKSTTTPRPKSPKKITTGKLSPSLEQSQSPKYQVDRAG